MPLEHPPLASSAISYIIEVCHVGARKGEAGVRTRENVTELHCPEDFDVGYIAIGVGRRRRGNSCHLRAVLRLDERYVRGDSAHARTNA